VSDERATRQGDGAGGTDDEEAAAEAEEEEAARDEERGSRFEKVLDVVLELLDFF